MLFYVLATVNRLAKQALYNTIFAYLLLPKMSLRWQLIAQKDSLRAFYFLVTLHEMGLAYRVTAIGQVYHAMVLARPQ